MNGSIRVSAGEGGGGIEIERNVARRRRFAEGCQRDILVFYLIRLSARGIIEFIINFRRTANFPGRGRPLAPVVYGDSLTLFQPGDSISIFSRPEVSREWLLSHFRTKKKSNERTMEPAG